MLTFLVMMVALALGLFWLAHLYFHKVLAGVKALGEEPPTSNRPELAIWTKKPRRADDPPCEVAGCELH